MNLKKCDVRPGKVLQVVDNYGTIKASAPGLFSEQDDHDLLPPVIPFLVPSSTAFVQPHVGDNIWVWYFYNNPQELLYTFRSNTKALNGEQLDNEYQDVEISMKRESDNGDVEVYYTDDDGYIINNGHSIINIDNKDHDVHITHKDGISLSITKDGISLGKKDGSRYKAVCGENLIDVLDNIKSLFNTIKEVSMGNPYTSHIGTALSGQINTLDGFENILSNKVTLE